MFEIVYETSGTEVKNINTITWTIPNFMKLIQNESTREFRTDILKDAAAEAIDSGFQLKIIFLGRDNYLTEIYYLSLNPVVLKSILKKGVSYYDEGSVITKQKYHKVQGNKWQYLARLCYHDYSNSLNGNGSLRLKFEFVVLNDIKVDSSSDPNTQLSHDFEYLLSNGLFSDVTMKSAEGDEYKVHKVVLASRSDVLKAHFEHNTIECQSNVVESSLQAKVLIEVLTFIYSDKAPRVDEIPEKLLAAADYYQLRGMKSLCEEALLKRLTVQNAIETLQMADLHSAKILKQFTLEFIKDQAKLITKTEGWAKFKSVELIKAICEFITADDVEADIK